MSRSPTKPGGSDFTSIFPGCYAGRWPHAHFEVYSSIEEATAGTSAIKTSQLAIPQAECEAVYADGPYGNGAQHLSRLSLDTDGIVARPRMSRKRVPGRSPG